MTSEKDFSHRLQGRVDRMSGTLFHRRVAIEQPIGYRFDTYQDKKEGKAIPVLIAAPPQTEAFELFLTLVDCLGEEVVDVILESSFGRSDGTHRDFLREAIDLPILKSLLWDVEELLTRDGCTGIAVRTANGKNEVQFDHRKLLFVYGHELGDFEDELAQHLPYIQGMHFPPLGIQTHSSSLRYYEQFLQLGLRLGVE